MFKWSKNLSNAMYDFMLDSYEGGSPEAYNVIFNNHYGKEWCFFFLLGICLLFTLIYYYVVAAKSIKATKGNYLSLYICGYITLTLVTLVGLTALVNGEASIFASFNVWKICLINILWYTVIYEVFSLVLKGTPMTAANNIDLISLFKN